MGKAGPPAQFLHSFLSPGFPLAFYADDLAQGVYYVHKIALRFHHGVDGLVCHRSFIDDVRVLTALDAGCCPGVVVQREATLRFRTRDCSSSSMTAR